ncbi:hypothetical protein [Chlorobium limicola]|uniref:Uncharacterized protein n=1 Tax=Chlorobium limicola TaxID=1092 RepID=A0A101JJ08_CHLLI|nr:hypothetical protein [Chlorobium limicola]KUL27662.1 hypothetical protein ASB62_06095 [Chlorobium limicola]
MHTSAQKQKAAPYSAVPLPDKELVAHNRNGNPFHEKNKTLFSYGLKTNGPDRPTMPDINTTSFFRTKEGTGKSVPACQSIVSETASEATIPAGPACSEHGILGWFTSIPGGTLTASLDSSNTLGAAFSMEADFISLGQDGSPAGGEYRQYVRGSFTLNGRPDPHRLCGQNLSQTTFHEDCTNIGGTIYKYGYRSIRFDTSYFDNPDQENGSSFHGWDRPGISGSSGETLMINLDFRGELVDICNNEQVLDSAEWSVFGSATVA